MSAVVARSRATQRIGRINHDLDRSSGYILGNIKDTSHVTMRRHRDSSAGTMGRPNLDLSCGMLNTMNFRIRDSSLPRMKELAGLTSTSSSNARHSVAIPSKSETAKYNREMAIKEIHSNFMKNYKETNNKLNKKNDGDGDGERRSKAYAKIVSNAPPSYLNEKEAQRQCISEVFMETNKFSSRTVAAINGLEGAPMRKKQDYQWRKDMEQYEKRADFERDVRARNVTALHRNNPDEDSNAQQNVSRKRQPPQTDNEGAIEKASRREKPPTPPTKPAKSWRERRDEANKANAAAIEETGQVERKGWRERLADKQKEEQELKQMQQQIQQQPKQQPQPHQQVQQERNEQPANKEGEVQTEAAQPAEAEEEDVNGTKKMKSDFNLMMSNLDAEMEAGRSKLAKLRERIRKAKGAIKAADDALAADDAAKNKS